MSSLTNGPFYIADDRAPARDEVARRAASAACSIWASVQLSQTMTCLITRKIELYNF